MDYSDPTGGAADRADAGSGAGGFTGAYLVLLDSKGTDSGLSALAAGTGQARVEHFSANDPGAALESLSSESSVAVFDTFSVAVVVTPPDRRDTFLAAVQESPAVLSVEPERVLRIVDDPAHGDYFTGYRDGVDDVVRRLRARSGQVAGAVTATPDEGNATWGLQAIRAVETHRTGRGIRLAVLDTGVALAHRDFAGRATTTASFITGETVEDGHGHGTHCVGTAAGPREPATPPRFGVAGECDVYVGKVLSNTGSGADRSILSGMNWAVAEGCRVVSMSLGVPAKVGQPYSQIYEHVARIALAHGTVFVAAAGNDSSRPGVVCPVAHPANCPSILAVAAVAPDLAVAPFSNAGLNPDGGQVDIAAPGVDVLSSWPEPTGYRKLSGTSMAAPHVAGVLALMAEANPAMTSAELRNELLTSAIRLPSPSTDVGAGLVRAP